MKKVGRVWKSGAVIFFLLAVVLILCWQSKLSSVTVQTQGIKDAEITIGTSFYPIYIMSLNIAKDVPGVRVINIAAPQTGCLHDYQLSAAEMKKIEECSVFIVNGAGMESYLDKVIEEHSDLRLIEASQGLDLIKEPAGNETEYNPHVWVSVIGAKDEVKNIASQLAQIDSRHAERYLSNALEYENQLEQLRQEMVLGLSEIKNRDIVTCHEAFDYFARDFGLEVQAVVQNDPGAEPSPREVAEVIDIVNTKQIKAIFAEPQYQTKAVRAIAEETKAKIFTLDPAVSGPMERDAYLNIMRENLQVLREALL